jgi:hypothetical protein
LKVNLKTINGNNQVWNVCTIDWISKTLPSHGAVLSLPPTGRLAKPRK